MRRGTRTGEIYVAASVDGDGINKGIADGAEEGFDDVERQSGPAGERSGERFSVGFRERLNKISEKAGARFNAMMGKVGEDAGEEAGDRAGKSMSKAMADVLDGDFADRIGDRLGDRIGESLSAAFSRTISDLLDDDEFNKKISAAVSGNGSGSSSRGFDIGRLFGAGSRNNFLNLFGKTIGSVVSLTQKGVGLVGKFADGFKNASDNASLLQKVMGGFGGVGSISATLQGLARSGPAALVIIGAVTLALAAMASVASALIAIVTALASTITSALVGAAAVGAGALMAMVAAGGLLTAAFMSMTNAQKEALSSAFQPLKAEMVGIGQLVLRDMIPAFATWSANLQRALLLLAPVASVMGEAFARAGNILTAAFSGPGFQAMATALGTYLPSIVTRLSTALGGFLNGVAGLFAAIMPMVNRFAGYLADVATRFSAWANSARGRNAIVDFVNRAVASLQSLWGFTRQVFGFISDVLFSRQAQNAGNSIFDSAARAFKGFRDAVARAIANGDLQRWFDDGIKLGAALWEVVVSLYKLFVSLSNSGVLDAIASGISGVANAFDFAAALARPLVDALGFVAGAFEVVSNALGNYLGMTDDVIGASSAMVTSINAAAGAAAGALATTFKLPKMPKFDLGELLGLGNYALDNTYESSGGYMPDPTKTYNNPYTQWAQQFIDSGPSMAAQIRQAVKQVARQFNRALKDAADAIGVGEARSIITSAIQSARDTAQSMVDAARSALSSAAQSLASAGSAKEAARALAEVRRMQEALRNAIKAQDRIEKAMSRFGNQRKVTNKFVDRLLEGDSVRRATLADYAKAREKLAARIDRANQKLADAIAMRKEYRAAVVESVKSFGSLLTAQAKTIDGVEQALTAGDIVDNLEDRLAKVRAFQANLQKLLALGLSRDAYKQLLDAGVESGSAYAEALLAGGQGAVAEVNDLVDEIGTVGESLGKEASNYLYNAGIEAAKGIVKGLESLDEWLGEWADWLGKTIANALQRALNGTGGGGKGGKGGGGKGGGGGGKGRSAAEDVAARAASGVAVSAEVARYAASRGQSVSGNGAPVNDIDVTIVTPTSDPHAVAMEAVNEIVGRL